MRNPTVRLLLTLGLGWLAFAGLGLGLQRGIARPTLTLVIDRSYCDPAQWQPIAASYATLYEQHRQGRLRIEQVIYVSDLGAVAAETIPTPAEVNSLTTFGRFNASQMEQITQAKPDAQVFSCHLNRP